MMSIAMKQTIPLTLSVTLSQKFSAVTIDVEDILKNDNVTTGFI